MQLYYQQTKLQSRTLDSTPRAAHQATFSAILQQNADRLPGVRRKNSNNGVVQRCGDAYDRLITLNKRGEKDKFKQQFRSKDPGKHELFSCEATSATMGELSDTKAREILKQSDETRMDTRFTGASVTLRDGSSYQVFHPTSASTPHPYGAPKASPEHYSSKGSTSLHKKIYDEVMAAPLTDRYSTAVKMNLGAFIQPPYASNSTVPHRLDEPDVYEAAQKREEIKKKVPGFDSSKTQPYDSSWYPDLTIRPLSPFRAYPPPSSSSPS